MPTDRRQRRRQRLTLLAAIFAALVLGVAGLWLYQTHSQNSELADLRTRGLAAYQAGDYATALPLLTEYVKDRNDDPDALFAAAESSYRQPTAGNLYLVRARRWLTRVRQLDAQHAGASELLLEMAKDFAPSDAVSITSDLLARNADLPEALLLRADKLTELERYDEARADIQRYLKLRPDDYRGHLLDLRIRHERHEPADQLLAEATQLAEQHPDDPRFELTVAVVLLLQEQPDQAKPWLQAAAKRPPPDDDFVTTLANAMDGAGLFRESVDYLERVSADRALDDELALEVTRRLFESGQYDAVLDRLESLMPSQPAEMFALRTMVLYELGKRDQAADTLTALRGLPDTTGKLWADVLEAFYAQPRIAADFIKTGEDAIKRGLIHPYLFTLLGEVQASVGDHNTAAQYQRQASYLRPNWAAPLLMAAKSYLALNQWNQADRSATMAIARRPDLLEPFVIKALAMGNAPRIAEPKVARSLVDYIDRILARVPREERLLVLKTRVIAVTGRTDDARNTARGMLAMDPPLAADTLLQLVDLSRQYKLGVEDDCLRTVAAHYGSTPQLAYSQAVQLADAGQPQAGLAQLEAAADLSQPSWQLTRATFLAEIADPRAAEAFRTLADAYPDRLELQRQLLQAPTVRRDRELSDQIIARLKALAGEQSSEWRTERARWYLTGPSPVADAGKAEQLLDEAIHGDANNAEAYLLRAKARELQNRLASAVEDVQSAQRIRPDATHIALEFARLQQALGNYPAALTQLSRVANSINADAETRRLAAAMLATQGEYATAVQLLESVVAGPNAQQPDRFLLAQLYARAGQTREADRAIAALLQAPTTDVITFAADYFAQTGRDAQAQQTLTLLPKTGADDATQRAVLARFANRHGDTREAAVLFTQAAEADPTQAAGWVRLAAYEVYEGRAQDALASAQRGLAAAGAHAGLTEFVNHGSEITALADDPIYRAIVAAILTDQAHRETAVNVVRLLADAQRSGQSPDVTVAGLRRLADENPDFQALQNTTVQVYMRMGDAASATEIARRTTSAFPNAMEPARLAALSLAEQGLWEQSLHAAMQWRKRAAADPFPADVLIARCQLHLDQASDALATLSPYTQRVSANPEGNADYAEVYGEALIRNQQRDQAQRFLMPKLASQSAWRLAWMRLAMRVIPDPPTRSQWLAAVTPLVPEDDVAQRYALAESWWALQWQNPKSGADVQARTIIDALAQRPDADALTFFLRGVMAEVAEQFDVAQSSYRRSLELDPTSTLTRNNLAMLLIDHGGAAARDEAVQLAKEAVAAEPRNPNYRDTLAMVLAKAGRYKEAIVTIGVAIELDPRNPQWRQRLAEIEQQRAGSGSAGSPARNLTEAPTP